MSDELPDKPKPAFTEPLQPSDLINLFPQLLEELDLREPDAVLRYMVIEREFLKKENEADMLERMGFYPYVTLAEAEASGDEQLMATEQMQQSIAKIIRDDQFMLATRTLEKDHYMRVLDVDNEHIIYVAREAPVPPYKKFLAAIAGVNPADIQLREKVEEETAATQYENFLMLVSMAEGALRKIKADGTIYTPDEKLPFTPDQIATRAFLAAEEVWSMHGGDLDLTFAYRQAHIIGDLTNMEFPENNEFQFGSLDGDVVEDVRQRIAYAILKGGRRSIDTPVGDDAQNLRRLSLPVMIRNAASLLNRFVQQAYDGDIDGHADAIGVVARYMDDKATQADRVVFDRLQREGNVPNHVALAYLANLISGYNSLCSVCFDAQEQRTPGIIRRAFDYTESYWDAALDDEPLNTTASPLVRHHAARHYMVVSTVPDRSMKRLERFRPSDDSQPH